MADEGSWSIGKIVGVAIAGLLLLVLLIAVWMYRRGLFSGQSHCVYAKHRSRPEKFTHFGIAKTRMGARLGVCLDHQDDWEKVNGTKAFGYEPPLSEVGKKWIV